MPSSYSRRAFRATTIISLVGDRTLLRHFMFLKDLVKYSSRRGQVVLVNGLYGVDLEYCPAPTAGIKVNYHWNDTAWGSDDDAQLVAIGAIGPGAL
ncbi:hypothetical protein E4U17_001732 [Claviceps sp. LM77 group G4]|nr:hypothetical protein E4U17_001732 [Claviceps sp. LM77 group G4]